MKVRLIEESEQAVIPVLVPTINSCDGPLGRPQAEHYNAQFITIYWKNMSKVLCIALLALPRQRTKARFNRGRVRELPHVKSDHRGPFVVHRCRFLDLYVSSNHTVYNQGREY